MSDHYVLVHDPKGLLPDGDIFTDAQARAHPRKSEGLVFIPVDPMLYKQSGVGGYQKRVWGSGFELSDAMPKMHAPLMLFGTPEHKKLTWRARIVKKVPNPTMNGQLRIAGDRGQPTPHYAGVSQENAIMMSLLGAPNDGDGWIVGGEARVSITLEGHHGFALYGAGGGLRVAWAAASLVAR